MSASLLSASTLITMPRSQIEHHIRPTASFETSPLIEASETTLRTSGLWPHHQTHIGHETTRRKAVVRELRLAGSKYLEDFRFAWPLVWPDGLSYRPLQCGIILLFQCALHWLFPQLLSQVTEMLLEPDLQGLRTCTFISGMFLSLFLKDYICSYLQTWLWIDVELRSEGTILRVVIEITLNCLDQSKRWATGAFLSDFNKGGSLNACLKIVLFTWTRIAVGVLTTSVDLWLRLGIGYGFLVTMIGLLYIYLTVRNAIRFVAYRRREVEKKRDRAAIATSLLCSVVDIALQNGKDAELARFGEVNTRYQDRVRESASILIFQNLLPNVIFFIGFTAMASFAATKHEEHRVKHFTVLVTYMIQLQGLLHSLNASMQKFLDSAVNSERLVGVIKDRAAVMQMVYTRDMATIPAEIAFLSVPVASQETFTYRCKPGTTTWIPGIPRPVKSQLVNYLARIDEPKPGTIAINGFDILEYSTASLRRHIGFIRHECKLMGETILESLMYGLEHPEGIDLETVITACRIVNIHDVISKIPGGYNARVGGDECALSVQEIRRLLLAKLRLRGCRVLVLDGVLAALKTEPDTSLQDTLSTVLGGATVVIFE